MIEQLLADYAQNLEVFFRGIDPKKVEEMVQLFLGCRGSLVFTGVGKSGVIAKKLALTMASTGTRAFFLSPGDALHGDIGILSSQDIVILLSKSGESEELIGLVPYLHSRGAETIAWVLKSHSKLARLCKSSFVLPFQKELCPFDLAPTTSTTIQLIFGDIISIALMKERGFDLDDYALNHPAGALGKKIHLKVRDLMLTGESLPVCAPDQMLFDVLVELTTKQCGCLVVVDQNKCLRGIFTDGDLRRALQSHSEQILRERMENLMTTNCLFTRESNRVWDALKLMQSQEKKWVSILPVVEENRLVGLIRMHDIIHAGIQ